MNVQLNHKEGWILKTWRFQIVVLDKTLETPLGCKEIKPVNPKGNQPWIFIGRNDADVEAPILWPLDAKSRLIGKDPDARKVWSKRRSGWQRMRWLVSITYSVDMNLSKLWKVVKDRKAWLAAVHRVTKRVRHDLATERQKQQENRMQQYTEQYTWLSHFTSPLGTKCVGFFLTLCNSLIPSGCPIIWFHLTLTRVHRLIAQFFYTWNLNCKFFRSPGYQ